MFSKRIIFLLGALLVLISVLGVCAAEYQQDNADIQYVLENLTDDELTGCCSVALQLDGNNSIFSFRRDANLTADVFIEQIDWHGMQAIKQYKTNGGYFCQVIITENGWVIGYGGIDDGPDNERIEQITSEMITDDFSISDEGLAQIQAIKEPYKKGHVLIKAPNGNYGIATDKGHFTGHLEPGEYVSMPNSYQFFRSGTVPLNTSDKIGVMNGLAISDAFGLSRRDVTTFYYQNVDNDTFKGSVVDAYLSNDDGSYFGMSTAGYVDNVYFNGTLFKAEDIPMAPDYEPMGSLVLEESPVVSHLTWLLSIIAFVVFVGALFYVILHFVRQYKYRY